MKYWAYINNEILGPYEKEKLFELPVFSASTLLCPQTPVGEKTEDWKDASAYPEIAAMLGSRPPGEGTEQPKTLPDAEMPENKSKSLSGQHIEHTPPPAAQHIDGADFKVNQLVSGRAHKDSEPRSVPSFTSANFDPMSISHIDRRANGLETPHREFTAPTPAPAAESASGPAQAPQAIPDAAPEASPAPEANTAPAFEHAQAAPAGTKSLDEINSKLETLNRNSLTKQDIEPLKEKLGQMGEVLSSMKSNQFQREIMDKIQYLENSLSDIKASLAQPRAAARPEAAKEGSLAPAEPKTPMGTSNHTIVDQGSGKKSSRIAGLIKKVFITLILLAAVAVGAAFALKSAGVFDITRFLPFPVPFLSAPQPAETPAPPPFQAGEALPQQGSQRATAPQPAPAKKDLSPEIIFIGRTFATKASGATLENRIYEDAAGRNGDSNRTTWQVKELPDGMYELDAVIPSLDRASQLVYSYKVDYAKKTVAPLDNMSAKPLGPILKKNQAPRQIKSQMKKARQGAAASKEKQPKPAVNQAVKQVSKQVKGKPAAAADDEYEYVYEDEAGSTEE